MISLTIVVLLIAVNVVLVLAMTGPASDGDPRVGAQPPPPGPAGGIAQTGPAQTGIAQTGPAQTGPAQTTGGNARPWPAPAGTVEPAPPGTVDPTTAEPTTAEPPLDLAEGVAIRATVGTCGADRSRLFWSDDHGLHWRPVSAPVTTVLRVQIVARDTAWLIGTDNDCRARFLRTVDGGRSWKTQASTSGAWHRLPDPAAGRLHAPNATVDSPCRSGPTVEVVGITLTRGAALCSDGSVHRTDDGGRSWRPAGSIGTAVALDFPDSRNGFTVAAAAVTDTACDGLRLHATSNAGKSWRVRGCVRIGSVRTAALAFTDSRRGLLATEDSVFATRDGGRNWSAVNLPQCRRAAETGEAPWACGSRRP